MAGTDPNEQRALTREAWETAAGGWGDLAQRIREWGLPVSEAMVQALALQPGERVLELAAGPGDTGFMAAELIGPGGTLVSSDGAEPMVEVARRRGAGFGLENVEFRQLELEWIDLPTASVDAVLCRWGIMLIVDPEAAAREIRRVLRPEGRAALAVWDVPARNPWSSVAGGAMVELGLAAPPDPQAPGPFALSAPGRLDELLQDTGFTEVQVTPVTLQRRHATLEEYIQHTTQMSPTFRAFQELPAEQQAAVRERIAVAAEPYTEADGSLTLPGSSLVARATA